MAVAHLSLGANLGDRRAALQAAVDGLLAAGLEDVCASSVYETDPVGLVLDQPAFLNACVRGQTSLTPVELLDLAKSLEAAAGRDFDAPRHSARALDVDVLLYDDAEIASERLTVPHPELAVRRFVLVPLLELDFALTLPGGRRLSEALAVLPLDDAVRRHGPPLRTRPKLRT